MSCVCTLQAKTLIVYYSYTNNVHRIVSDLQTQIEADVLRIEPAEEGLDYAANNYALGSALIAAIRNNPANPDSYPAIKTSINNLDEYDTIIIGLLYGGAIWLHLCRHFCLLTVLRWQANV